MKEATGAVLISIIVSVGLPSKPESGMVKGCPGKILCSGAITM